MEGGDHRSWATAILEELPNFHLLCKLRHGSFIVFDFGQVLNNS